MMEVFDRFMNIQTPIYHILDLVVIQVLHFHLTSQLPELLQRNRNMVLWILQYHIISITILKKKPQSNSHVECIDEWLRLNVKCPRCRCSVFPNPDLSALSNLHPDSERSSASVVTTTSYVRDQSLPCRTGDCTSKPNISE